MKRYGIAVNGLMLFLLLGICVGSWSAEDRIAGLQKQISTLGKQKGQLEAEKQKLMAKGDKLSLKIEDLKMQAKGGLGIIGRYRLSRSLRKAQALSEEIQILQKKIRDVGTELKGKRSDLEREYGNQIAILLSKLNGVNQTGEGREILEKLKEYQAAKEQLAKPEKEELEHLDITKIEIKDYDGPQEIREKADLINDSANKLDARMKRFTARIEKLREELKTRRKLGEFAEEITFFGERISKEIAGNTEEGPGGEDVEEPDKEEPVTMGTDGTGFIVAIEPIGEPSETAKDQPSTTEIQPSTPPSKMVMERNGVSADFAGVSLDQIEKQIKLLEKRRQELEKELSTLSEKANSFYEKADEIEESETKTGGKKR